MRDKHFYVAIARYSISLYPSESEWLPWSACEFPLADQFSTVEDGLSYSYSDGMSTTSYWNERIRGVDPTAL